MYQSALPQSFGASFTAGIIDVLPLLVGLVPFGLIVGALGIQSGLSTGEVMMMSGLVFAGAAQFIALDMWGSAAGLTIVSTTLLVNLRHVLMGASARPQIVHMPRWLKWPFLYVMADENWATVMRRARTHGDLTPGYVAGASVPFYVGWQITCYIGTQAGSVMGDPATWGFDFVFTAVFITLVFSFWRVDRRSAPIVASAAVALAAEHYLGGTWYILLGGVAGVAAALLTFKREGAT
ncbi:MAG: AzlC family ABC transporter permease [Rhodospirillales bacterium]